jgi:hypothetical protein
MEVDISRDSNFIEFQNSIEIPIEFRGFHHEFHAMGFQKFIQMNLPLSKRISSESK